MEFYSLVYVCTTTNVYLRYGVIISETKHLIEIALRGLRKVTIYTMEILKWSNKCLHKERFFISHFTVEINISKATSDNLYNSVPVK